jgi:hypothetical protein
LVWTEQTAAANYFASTLEPDAKIILQDAGSSITVNETTSGTDGIDNVPSFVLDAGASTSAWKYNTDTPATDATKGWISGPAIFVYDGTNWLKQP